VAFTCEWCGQSVVLLVTDAGDELPDARAFLAQHQACLHHPEAPPDKPRSIVLPA
jgi:hypothetical protein